jgi:hypothetical protein
VTKNKKTELLMIKEGFTRKIADLTCLKPRSVVLFIHKYIVFIIQISFNLNVSGDIIFSTFLVSLYLEVKLFLFKNENYRLRDGFFQLPYKR